MGAPDNLAMLRANPDSGLMIIEALRMPGNGKLTVTGQLGDVMRESVDAAYSYVRSRAAQLHIEPQEFRDSDLHVHFPAGAIPKDGPAAHAADPLPAIPPDSPESRS